MEDKIPTAEYWIKNEMNIIDVQESAKKLIEFTELHVKEALKQASEKAEMNLIKYTDDYEINRHSILTAYNLDNIK